MNRKVIRVPLRIRIRVHRRLKRRRFDAASF
jgi:hypothetical protein